MQSLQIWSLDIKGWHGLEPILHGYWNSAVFEKDYLWILFKEEGSLLNNWLISCTNWFIYLFFLHFLFSEIFLVDLHKEQVRGSPLEGLASHRKGRKHLSTTALHERFGAVNDDTEVRSHAYSLRGASGMAALSLVGVTFWVGMGYISTSILQNCGQPKGWTLTGMRPQKLICMFDPPLSEVFIYYQDCGNGFFTFCLFFASSCLNNWS